MTAPSSIQSPQKSRGHSLFDRQAQLHAPDPNKQSTATISDTPIVLKPEKSANSIPLPSVPSSVATRHHQHSPLLTHRRSPMPSTKPYAHSNDTNVQLLSVHPRPELTYIKELPPQPSTVSSKLLETDFPLYEDSGAEESEKVVDNSIVPNVTAATEKAFDHSPTHDDDDDVIHLSNNDGIEYSNDGFDDDNDDNSFSTNDLDTTVSIHNYQSDSKFSFDNFNLVMSVSSVSSVKF